MPHVDVSSRSLLKSLVLNAIITIGLVFGCLYAHVAEAQAIPDLEFTPEEHAWIAAHPVVSYTDDHWPPLFTLKDGQGKVGESIFNDIYALVSQRTGLRFQYQPYPDFGAMLKAVYNGDVDMIDGTGETPERKAQALFSDPFLAFPFALVSRKENQHWNVLEKLHDQRIAVPANYTAHEFLRDTYPYLSLVTTASTEDALRRVSTGEAQLALDILPVVYDLIIKKGFANLTISGLTDYHVTFHAMVRPGAPELVSILNKAFATLSSRELSQIYENRVGGLGTFIKKDHAQAASSPITLSDAERSWLDARHTVRVRITRQSKNAK